MSNYPNDSHGDIQEWGLTRVQAARYHVRLSGYHARRAVHYADLSVHYANKAVRTANFGIFFAVAALLILAVGLVAS